MSRSLKLWLQAFRGFYRQKGSDAELDQVSKWLFASRSVILIISAQAGIIAGLLAYTMGSFDLLSFVLVLLGFTILHAASNLSNDYFGHVRGHDVDDSPRMRYTIHPLASGVLSKNDLRIGISILLGVAALITLYFVSIRGLYILAFAAAGVSLLYLYDASPITLKSIGLGEVAAFLVWGPIMVTGGYYSITGSLSLTSLTVSVPYGLSVMSILVGKHIDQIDFDTSKSQKTLPVLLGEKNARVLNQVILAAMYTMIPLLIILGHLTLFSLIVFLNLRRAWNAISRLGKAKPAKPPEGYVGWPLWYHRSNLVQSRTFGWLYILALFLGSLLHI